MTALYKHKRLDRNVEGGEKIRLSNAVEIFTFHHGNPTSAGRLLPGTVVIIDEEETRSALKKGFKFVHVTAAESGTSGYIPKWVVNDFLFAKHTKGEDWTGVSYGGDKWMMDANKNLHAFPIDPNQKQRCARCAASANKHKLMETEVVRNHCGKFAFSLGDDLLRGLDRGHLDSTGVMIGVLRTDRGWFFSHSGSNTHGLFASAVAKYGRETGLAPVRAAPSLAAADPFRVNPRNGTFPFATIAGFAGFAAGASIADLVCAAPKLIQAAYAANETPLVMSERWTGFAHGRFGDLDTIKSCDRCRRTLSFMLCPV
jgi:hypothetical protein